MLTEDQITKIEDGDYGDGWRMELCEDWRKLTAQVANCNVQADKLKAYLVEHHPWEPGELTVVCTIRNLKELVKQRAELQAKLAERDVRNNRQLEELFKALAVTNDDLSKMQTLEKERDAARADEADTLATKDAYHMVLSAANTQIGTLTARLDAARAACIAFRSWLAAYPAIDPGSLENVARLVVAALKE